MADTEACCWPQQFRLPAYSKCDDIAHTSPLITFKSNTLNGMQGSSMDQARGAICERIGDLFNADSIGLAQLSRDSIGRR